MTVTTDIFAKLRAVFGGKLIDASDVEETADAKVMKAAERAALKGWSTLAPMLTEAGSYYAWSNGAKVANAGWTSKTYACTAGEAYRVTASIGGDVTGMVLFFNDAGALVDKINRGPTSGFVHYKRQVFSAPAGATKLVVSGSNTGGAAIVVDQGTLVAQAAQQVLDNGVSAERLKSFNALAPVWTAGFYVSTTTGAQVASGTVSNALIAVDGGETMRVSGTLVASATLPIAMVTFLDPRGQPIGALYAPTSGNTTVAKVNQEFPVPDDCRAVAITLTTTFVATSKVERFEIAPRVLQDTRDRLATAEGGLTDNSANLSKLKSWYSIGGAPIAGEYYNRSTGAIAANAAWHRLAPIAVTPGQEIRFTGTVSGAATAGIVFLNASSAYLSRMFDGVNGSSVEYADQPVIVPAGAAFACVCSYMATSNTEPMVKSYGIDPALASAAAGGTAGPRLDAIEPPLARMRNTGDRLVGKKVLWMGTSIPAGASTSVTINGYTGANKYPSMIAAMTGATIVNVALGSSIARAGIFANKNAGAGDPLGWTGMAWDNLWRSLSHTAADKNELINNWESKWRDLLSGSGKPTSLDTATQAAWRAASYEAKLTPNLDSGLFVFDHGHNDLAVAPGGYTGTELMDRFNADPASRDRTTFHGAINYLIDIILAANSRAPIIFSGHYENARKPQIALVQDAVAKFWGFPLIKLWELTGWSQQVITGGADVGKTMTQLWLPDDLHPHSDTTGRANWRIAQHLAPRLQMNGAA